MTMLPLSALRIPEDLEPDQETMALMQSMGPLAPVVLVVRDGDGFEVVEECARLVAAARALNFERLACKVIRRENIAAQLKLLALGLQRAPAQLVVTPTTTEEPRQLPLNHNSKNTKQNPGAGAGSGEDGEADDGYPDTAWDLVCETINDELSHWANFFDNTDQYRRLGLPALVEEWNWMRYRRVDPDPAKATEPGSIFYRRMQDRLAGKVAKPRPKTKQSGFAFKGELQKGQRRDYRIPATIDLRLVDLWLSAPNLEPKPLPKAWRVLDKHSHFDPAEFGLTEADMTALFDKVQFLAEKAGRLVLDGTNLNALEKETLELAVEVPVWWREKKPNILETKGETYEGTRR